MQATIYNVKMDKIKSNMFLKFSISLRKVESADGEERVVECMKSARRRLDDEETWMFVASLGLLLARIIQD